MGKMLLFIPFLFPPLIGNPIGSISQEIVSGKINAIELDDCQWQGINLCGKVQIVESFPDFKIQYVTSFADIKVKFVNAFPDACGKWQMVDVFPDFTVQVVTSIPDLKVERVSSFPGTD